MASSPLIKNINISGGTFYAFSSAAKDSTKVKANDNLRMEYTKFVCLRLPELSKLDFSTFSHFENYLQLDAIDGTIFNGGLSGDPNVDLSQSLQNYVLNLESLILSDDDYDHTIKHSTSERIFFKWLKEAGAIRFRSANTKEYSTGVTSNKFVEEDEKLTGSDRYSKVVQYIGDIDINNNVDKAGESYSEIYLRIPTQAGNTPVVLFDALTDTNYKPNLIITGSSEYINNRNSTTIHPDGLSINAYYDYDASVDYTDPNANWHNEAVTGGNINSYFTELSTFEDSSNIDIKKYYDDYNPGTPNGVAYRRSKLDGISIDFEPSNYYDITIDSEISTIQQYNSVSKSNNFEFNAILIYYDIYNSNNISDRATNLYGILILDNITPTSDGGSFTNISKIKPNPITKLNGNSYGLSLNLKDDISIVPGGVDTIINEYNNFSLGLFSDATVKLQEASKLLTDQVLQFNDIKNQIDDIEARTYAIDSILELGNRIDILESNINNAQLAFNESTALLDLIASNSDEIQNIISGRLSIDLTYNTEVLQPGPGIKLDKSILNRIIVENTTQEYNFSNLTDINGNIIDTDNPINLNSSDIRIYSVLKPYTNMVRIYTDNSAISKFKIYIDDSQLKFKKGQVIRVVFPGTLDLNENNIEIYTDSKNLFGAGTYKKIIGTINTLDFISNKPIFEIICEDSATYKFSIDIIR